MKVTVVKKGLVFIMLLTLLAAALSLVSFPVFATGEDGDTENGIYVSSGETARPVGTKEFFDEVKLNFSGAIAEANRANVTVSVNGKSLSELGANVVAPVWNADGTQVTIKFLFFRESMTETTKIFKYDGTDEIVVSGVTAEANTLVRTADGQLYNTTKGETAPAAKTDLKIKELSVSKNQDGANKDRLHIFFEGNVDVLGSYTQGEGVLFFNTGTILINGKNLQAFWDANNSTGALSVNAGENHFVAVDIHYDGLPEGYWHRDGQKNVITVAPSFLTLSGKELAEGFGNYVYDFENMYPENEVPEEKDLAISKVELPGLGDQNNDWLNIVFSENIVDSAQINIQNHARISENLLFGTKTVTQLNAGDVAKIEIHAGTEALNTVRVSIPKTRFDAILKKDGADEITVKAGFGLNKYQTVASDYSVSGLNDVTAPTLTLTSTTGSVKDAAYEIQFTGEDDSEFDTSVTCNGTDVTATTEGKYLVTLNAGANTIVVTLQDKSFFKNTTTQTITVTYDKMPVLTISGAPEGPVTNQKNFNLTVATGGVTADIVVKLGETPLTAGTDGKYAVTLAEGENTITVTATNGISVATKTITLSLDTTAPVIETSVEDNTTVTDANFSFTVTSVDGTVVVKVNGTVAELQNGKYSVTLNEGANAIVITSTDAAGNTGTLNRTVTLDTTAPVIETSVEDNMTVDNAEFSFTVTSADGTVVVKVNGTVAELQNGKYSVTLNEGANAIVITSTDAAGNSGTLNRTVTYTKAAATEEESGCGSSVSGSSAALALAVLLLAVGTVCVMTRKTRN